MLKIPDPVCVAAVSFDWFSFAMGLLAGVFFTAFVMVVWEIVARWVRSSGADEVKLAAGGLGSESLFDQS